MCVCMCVCGCVDGFFVCKLTGKTSGMPPLTALLPSSTAPSLSQSFSLPPASFQLRTVAPCSRTSTVSPVGSAALTRPSSMSTVGWAWDCCGVAARAEGLLGRSTIVAIGVVCTSKVVHVLQLRQQQCSSCCSTGSAGSRRFVVYSLFGCVVCSWAKDRRYGSWWAETEG